MSENTPWKKQKLNQEQTRLFSQFAEKVGSAIANDHFLCDLAKDVDPKDPESRPASLLNDAATIAFQLIHEHEEKHNIHLGFDTITKQDIGFSGVTYAAKLLQNQRANQPQSQTSLQTLVQPMPQA
jgi:hypothetical protein